MLFTEAIEAWKNNLEIRVSKASLKSNLFSINYFNKFLEEKYNSMIYLDELKTEDVEDFFRYLKTERNNCLNTLEAHRRRISAFYNHLKLKGVQNENIVDKIGKIKTSPKPRVYLSEDEVIFLTVEMKKPLLQVFYKFLYFSGLRLGEALKLTLDDINLNKKLIYVKQGKGGKNRTVPISEKLNKILKNYLENIRPELESKMFFATKRTGTLSDKYTRYVLRNTLINLGWKDKGITAHSFRHSFASGLVKNKVNLKVIQKLLGHYDITVTAIYLNADAEDMKKAVEEL